MFADLLQLPFRYLAWHYSRALVESARLWATGFRFVTRLFAVPLHLRTLLAPFERLGEPVHGAVGDRLEAAAVNLIMRMVGLVARLGVIASALAAYAAVALLSVAAFVGWLLLPPALALSFWIGVRGLSGGTFN